MFNVFKKILEGKDISIEDPKKVSEFVMLRWLSGDARLIELANTINMLKMDSVCDTQVLCLALRDFFNKRIRFIRYPKGQGKKDAEIESIIKYIASYFDVSMTVAGEYYAMMVDFYPSEIDEIRRLYKLNKD